MNKPDDTPQYEWDMLNPWAKANWEKNFKCVDCGNVTQLKNLSECEIYGHLLCIECWSSNVEQVQAVKV